VGVYLAVPSDPGGRAEYAVQETAWRTIGSSL
jgi:hypothetical protein